MIKLLTAVIKLFIAVSLFVSASCSSHSRLIRYERTGVVIAEVWKKKDNTCERRVYLDSMYFVTVVPCAVNTVPKSLLH